MANTIKSVREVTVMATPALRMVSATVEGMSEDNLETMMSGAFFFTQSPLSWGQIVVALHDHKHVVDANAKQEEGDDVVHWSIEEADGRANTAAGIDERPKGLIERRKRNNRKRNLSFSERKENRISFSSFKRRKRKTKGIS